MKKILIFCSLLLILGACYAQEGTEKDKGIRFEQNKNWEQILAIAKAGHKYIFVDCYATWCGPCKEMDREIYPLKEVGDYYNTHFISVKIQMDPIPKDGSDSDGVVENFIQSYSVNSYPTFLFFDADGRPLHKYIGTLGAGEFIQLAKDAQGPDKQYYSILKNFAPGKLDTAEEKGLARSFIYSDKDLAAKLAIDYLERIPRDRLALKDNKRLMVEFQNSPQVLAKAVSYLNQISYVEFGKKDNLDFVERLSEKPEIKQLAVNYINDLNNLAICEDVNLDFIPRYKKEPQIQQLAKNYIDKLTADQLYTKKMIRFITEFTTTTSDRGFGLFYKNANKINAIMGDRAYSERMVVYVITKEELTPALTIAKEKEVIPDFDAISRAIRDKYTSDLAAKVIISGKVSWYLFWVQTKKNDKYWPQLIDTRINQVKMLHYDTLTRHDAFCNNICWGEIFLHSENKEQLIFAANWLRNLIDRNPKSFMLLDTYACILYKAGKKDEAIHWENKALQSATLSKSKKDIEYSVRTLGKIKDGESFWTQKEYQ